MNRFEPKMRELEATPLYYDEDDGHNIVDIHLTEAQIQEAERQMGGRFPDDYREFIRDFGAFGVHAVFPVDFTLRRRMSISEFNGIIAEKSLSVWDIVSNYLSYNSDVWREEWLHLGSTGGSHSIALAFKGKEVGCVYTFDIEYEPQLVASSFSEFMNMLQKVEDEPIYTAEVNRFWNSFSTP